MKKIIFKTTKFFLPAFFITAVLGLVFLNSAPAIAQDGSMEELQEYIQTIRDWALSDFQTFARTSLAKAKPDECFYDIGSPDNSFVATGIDADACIDDGGKPKVNQAYVWGLAKSGPNMWFGTAPNVHCLVMSGYLDVSNPIETGSYVCEFGSSAAGRGDWRPPRIYAYNTLTQTLTDKTPNDAALNTTTGIRSAGTLGDVVFLAGPGYKPVNTQSGIAYIPCIALFAFNSKTGAYIGSSQKTGYNNIRKWLVVNNVLYTAVGTRTGGKVLKWTGTATAPFSFEEVGNLDSSGAELAFHENRIFVSTWPGGGELTPGGNLAGLWMSPEVPAGGLTNANLDSWQKVWKVDDYEPDPVTASTYGGGALASFDGYLYWGTMHVPMLSALAHSYYYEYDADLEDVLKAMLGTYRAISIFRGQNFGSEGQNIQLVYGMPKLPVFVGVQGGGGCWEMRCNNMENPMPLYGPSGFGNPFNNYTWTMDVFQNQLFVGTMDWSYLIFGESEFSLPEEMPFDCNIFQGLGITCEQMEEIYAQFVEAFDPTRFFGADLFRFKSSDLPAIPESLAGVGNYTSYGIRTMVSAETLYLGMANPMNLLTDTTDSIPEGGWELVRLGLRGDIDGDGDIDTNDLSLLLANLGKPSSACPYADLNGDGLITVLDVRLIVNENPLLARDLRVRRLLR